jgi:hypothetical protein
MEPNIFTLITKKIITTVIAIGSVFYSSISGVNAEFTDIDIHARGEQLVISTELTNCFSEELDLIFESGKEISIYYRIEVVQASNSHVIHADTLTHTIHYSLVDNAFNVRISEVQQTLYNLPKDRAKSRLAKLNEVPILSLHNLLPRLEYYIQTTAWMGKVSIEGTREKLNLMYYWNSIKPEVRSIVFTGSEFEK